VEAIMLKAGCSFSMTIETPVVEETDVLVLGGGTAGVLAALAAARNGARTILVERYGYLGGMITAGNAGLTMYMKFSGQPSEHEADQKSLETKPEEVQIAGGITKEFADRLISSGVGIGNFGQAGSYIFTSSEDCKRLLFDMMAESGVKLRLHSWAVDVVMEGNRVAGVVVESKSGREIIAAGMVIDATGDGDICVRAGVPSYLGVTPLDLTAKAGSAKVGDMHAMGVMFKAGNVDLQTTFDWLVKNPDRFGKQPFARFTLEEAKERFERGDMATINILMDETPKRFQVYNLPTEGVVTLCCPSYKGDGTNVEDLSRAEVVLASMVDRWLANMRSLPGFEKAFLLDCPQIGVRETRHIVGEHMLDIEEIFKQTDFPDSIGRGSHPIDTTPRPDWLRDPETSYPPRWYFHIPFGSLIAKDVENLMVVGRCMSATHEAFGCIRPTVQCMITGEAAGTAGALCTKDGIGNIRALPVDQLRKTLADQGVLL
jgi:hypothetical protein